MAAELRTHLRADAGLLRCGIAVLNWEVRYFIGAFFGNVQRWSRDVPTYQYRCSECGKSFERTETITEHEAAKVRCPKCNSKKVTQVPGRVHVVTSKKS